MVTKTKRTIKVDRQDKKNKVDRQDTKCIEMSGGSVSYDNQNENDFVRDVALKIIQCNNHRRKYDEEYIDD